MSCLRESSAKPAQSDTHNSNYNYKLYTHHVCVHITHLVHASCERSHHSSHLISSHLIWPNFIWTECAVIGYSRGYLGCFTADEWLGSPWLLPITAHWSSDEMRSIEMRWGKMSDINAPSGSFINYTATVIFQQTAQILLVNSVM